MESIENLKIIRTFYEDYYSSIDFKEWQNKFSNKIYSSLNSGGKEVDMVTKLCQAMSNQEHKGLHIKSEKIHGKKSYVEFAYTGKKTTRELADMVIVSVVTLDQKIVLLKLAFIQNKKAEKNKIPSWSYKIDPEQLFLLKNFPTFIGTSGIFNNDLFKGKEIIFPNYSGTLGNYGLFTPNSDMIFLTARNVFCNQSASGTITFGDIKKASSLNVHSADTVNSFHPYKYGHCIDFFRENRFILLSGRYNLPFFNNYDYALDVHEIVRQLTYFNIGEPLNIFGHITDNYLYFYAKTLLQLFGYTINDNNLYRNRENNDIRNENETNVILNYLELGERKD